MHTQTHKHWEKLMKKKNYVVLVKRERPQTEKLNLARRQQTYSFFIVVVFRWLGCCFKRNASITLKKKKY